MDTVQLIRHIRDELGDKVANEVKVVFGIWSLAGLSDSECVSRFRRIVGRD